MSLEKGTGAEKVRWDLSFIYKDVDDPQINKDIADYKTKTSTFQSNYKGKLKEKLGSAITDFTDIEMLSDKILVYCYVKQSTDLSESKIKSKYSEAEKALSQCNGEFLTFFGIELVAIDDAALEHLYATDPVVLKHKPWIEYRRIFKPHLLTEPVEAALMKRSSFGTGAWSEFFDELESDLQFTVGEEKKTLTEMINILSESKDASLRANALRIINMGLEGAFAKYSAQTLYMVTGLKSVEGKERGYKHAMEERNKLNRIPDAIVDTLHTTISEVAGPLARRYYRLKAAHLGMKTLKWSDRNAPVPFTDNTVIPFEEAWTTVLAAYESFSPKLAQIVRDLGTKRWIDAPATKGKRGGAFNYSLVLPDNKPTSFILLNYLGSNHDVMVLAHELGHGVHGILAGETQGALMFHAPTAYAETASVFGEITTFQFLKNRLAEKKNIEPLIALLMGKIDATINTIVRQISFSNFERRIHGMDTSYHEWKEAKKLSVKEINDIWLQVTKELYGEEGDVFTYENMDHQWSYIAHFHRPFYVYSYTFGELLTQSLYAEQARLGSQFEPLYLDLLRAGSTKDVIELLRPFGLNPSDKKFWSNGIDISLKAMIDEVEELSRSIGITT